MGKLKKKLKPTSELVCLVGFDYGRTDADMDLGPTFVEHESETCQTGLFLDQTTK